MGCCRRPVPPTSRRPCRSPCCRRRVPRSVRRNAGRRSRRSRRAAPLRGRPASSRSRRRRRTSRGIRSSAARTPSASWPASCRTARRSPRGRRSRRRPVRSPRSSRVSRPHPDAGSRRRRARSRRRSRPRGGPARPTRRKGCRGSTTRGCSCSIASAAPVCSKKPRRPIVLAGVRRPTRNLEADGRSVEPLRANRYRRTADPRRRDGASGRSSGPVDHRRRRHRRTVRGHLRPTSCRSPAATTRRTSPRSAS